MDHTKEFIKIFETLGRRHDRHRVFLDWLTMTASSLLARSSPWHREDAERDYQQAVKGYDAAELDGFARLFGIVTLALEHEFQDFLGHVYMAMELGNKHQGQFFTPYHLSRACAGMIIGTPDPTREIITLQEPACGSGGMLIAAMEHFRSHGINYQTQTYSVAVDVSEMAARMCYIQLSIIGCPAQVVLGNTLSMETRATWPTLFYGMVCHKVARYRQQQAAKSEASTENPEANVEKSPEPTEKSKTHGSKHEAAGSKSEQLALF